MEKKKKLTNVVGAPVAENQNVQTGRLYRKDVCMQRGLELSDHSLLLMIFPNTPRQKNAALIPLI